jgi:adenylate cyclase
MTPATMKETPPVLDGPVARVWRSILRAGARSRATAGDSHRRRGDFERIQFKAERTLALLRLLNLGALWLVFAGARATELDHSLSLSLRAYGAITMFGLVCTLMRFYRPWLPSLLATFDVVVLLHCQAMFATTPGWSFDHALMAPGAIMIALILVTTAVRHRPWLVLYTAGLYIGGWLALWAIANADVIASTGDARSLLSKFLNESVLLVVVALIGATLFVSVRYSRHHLLTSLAEREIVQALARFVPPPLLHSMARSGVIETPASLRDLAVLMVDIRGFTAMAERLPPFELIELLDGFRSLLVRSVERHGGTIDKFIGDGALVVFGVEPDRLGAAAAALDWACRLGPELEKWNRTGGVGRENIQVAIGGHWGAAVVGVVGSGDRREFTALGDAVNVAARVQQLASSRNLRLVVSEELLLAAGAATGTGIWQELQETNLRGRRAGIRLFAGDVGRIGSGAG